LKLSSQARFPLHLKEARKNIERELVQQALKKQAVSAQRPQTSALANLYELMEKPGVSRK